MRALLVMLMAVFLLPSALISQVRPLSALRPDWIGHLPSDDVYDYYRGTGVDGDFERAKVLARTDAVRMAQMAHSKGIAGAASDAVAISDEGTSVSSEVQVAFDPAEIRGFEIIEDHSEEIPVSTNQIEYTPGSSRARRAKGIEYRYWVLVRVPKPASGRGTRSVIGGRMDALFHSAILPGWGQMRQGRQGSGLFYMAAATLSGVAAGTFYVLEKEEIPAGGKQRDWGPYKRGAIYVFAGAYGANLVDALLFGRENRTYRVSTDFTGLRLSRGF